MNLISKVGLGFVGRVRPRVISVVLLVNIFLGCTERPVMAPEGTALERLARIELSFAAGSNLLLVIDDSISMADKQRILAKSLSHVFTMPRCQTADGTPLPFGDYSELEGVTCKGGIPRTGIITSSLAAGGNTACEGRTRGAHLLPLPDGKLYADFTDLQRDEIEAWIQGVGERGCGYEAPLEAMYRFLVEPEPLLEDDEVRIDERLLGERASFLFPGGVLTILILTDEDDCSVMDTEAGALMLRDTDMPRGTSACAGDPSDACCRSCETVEDIPPEGCVPLVDDESCRQGPLPWAENDPNLRCFDQKRRFGASALYPIERYVRGLTETTIIDRHGREVRNPLFTGGRTPDMVHLAVVAGVPWQLLATDESLDEQRDLTLLTPDQLKPDVWETLWADVHLQQSIAPRAGLAQPDSGRLTDAVHGHEFDNPHQAALQYSCVFPLPEPRDCSDSELCICDTLEWPNGTVEPLSPNNPLCQAPDHSYTRWQYFAGAEPPVRLLQVAERVDALLASACPKTLDEALNTETAYGYTAAGAALLPWFYEGGSLEGVCLTEAWPDDAIENERCKVIERVPKGLTCSLPARAPVAAEYGKYTLHSNERLEDYTFCEILPVPGDPKEPGTPAFACANDAAPDSEAVGYCLIDPARGVGSRNLVEMCPAEAARRVRLLPANLGRENAWQLDIRLRLVCR